MQPPKKKLKAKSRAAPATRSKTPPPNKAAERIRKIVRFDVQAFLDTVGVGRFIGKYKKGEVVFLQGDPAERRP